MADKYALRYLPVAVDDLISILDWIANDSPANAGYRVLVIETYLVFYVVRGKTVEIHRVVHGSRNLEDIV